MDYITCKVCGITKAAIKDNFYWRNDSKSWRLTCCECILSSRKSEYHKESDNVKNRVARYREANRDKIIKHMKEYNSRLDVQNHMKKYRADNRKALREKEKAWREKNPEKAKEIDRRKLKKRMQNPIAKIRQNVSRGIGLALRRNGSSKAGDSIMNHLDFSIYEFKKHLEALFEPWMNWNNYGSYTKNWDDENPSTWRWQIDHIIPQSEFEYDSMDHAQFKECWKLTNLRPYSSKRNCLDGCNRIRHKGSK